MLVVSANLSGHFYLKQLRSQRKTYYVFIELPQPKGKWIPLSARTARYRYRGSYILSRGVTSRSPYGRRIMVADHDSDFFL